MDESAAQVGSAAPAPAASPDLLAIRLPRNSLSGKTSSRLRLGAPRRTKKKQLLPARGIAILTHNSLHGRSEQNGKSRKAMETTSCRSGTAARTMADT